MVHNMGQDVIDNYDDDYAAYKTRRLLITLLTLVTGIVGLIGGAHLLVEGAVGIAIFLSPKPLLA